jgi:hypothetical protein
MEDLSISDTVQIQTRPTSLSRDKHPKKTEGVNAFERIKGCSWVTGIVLTVKRELWG